MLFLVPVIAAAVGAVLGPIAGVIDARRKRQSVGHVLFAAVVGVPGGAIGLGGVGGGLMCAALYLIYFPVRFVLRGVIESQSAEQVAVVGALLMAGGIAGWLIRHLQVKSSPESAEAAGPA